MRADPLRRAMAVAACVAVACAFCLPLLAQPAASSTSASAAPALPAVTSLAGLPIGPGDLLSITVLDEPKLTGQFQVRDDGKINWSIAGMVQAAGLTPTQLEDQLTTLAGKYVIKPVVSVIATSTVPRVVSILGQVARPGTYDVRACPTVLALLANAGGALPAGDMASAVLIRGQKTEHLMAERSQEAMPKDLPLQAGDTVYIPPRQSALVMLMGAVVAPGPQPIAVAATASKAAILAGGPTPTADLRHAYLLRGQGRLEVNLAPFLGNERDPNAKDMPLESGDVLVVPQRIQSHVFVVGAVNAPGPEPIDEARFASQAIAMAGGLSDAADKTGAYLLRDGEKRPLDLAALFDQGKTDTDVSLEVGDAIVVPKRMPMFHIVGEVKTPGAYNLDQASNVLDAWALTGGELEDADLAHCVLLREGQDPRTIDVDALVNRGDRTQNAELRVGDTLVVPKALDYVYVLGQVAKPGPHPLKAGDTLMDILGRAGGPTPLADVASIVLVHKEQLVAAAEATGAGGAKPEAKPASTPAQPKGGQKLTLVDLAKVQSGKTQYVARVGDVLYVPALQESRGSDWLRLAYGTISALLVGLAVYH